MNDLLKQGERLFGNEIVGPETLIVDKEGEKCLVIQFYIL